MPEASQPIVPKKKDKEKVGYQLEGSEVEGTIPTHV
jgi:hypothetical protein